MQEHLPITNVTLRDLQCLHPIARKAECSRAAVEKLCLHLRRVSKSDSFADDVSAEWLLYSAEQDLDSIKSTGADVSFCPGSSQMYISLCGVRLFARCSSSEL
jgi:hypothetical protein